MQYVGACRGMGIVHQLNFSPPLHVGAHPSAAPAPGRMFLKAAWDILGFIEALKVHPLGISSFGLEDVWINYPSIYNTNMEIHVYVKYIQILVLELKRPSVFISKDSFLVRSTPTFTYKELNGVLPPQFSGMVDDTRNRSYTVTSVSRQDSFSAVNSGWHSHGNI